MATILRIKPQYFRYSVQLKYAVSYIVLIVVILVFINIFPVIRFRDMLFESKYSSMRGQTDVLTSSLSSLMALYPEEVAKVMELLDEMNMTRVIVANTDLTVVYDSLDNENNVGKYVLYSEVSRALTGKSIFYAHYSSSALISKMAVPITYKNNIIGAVFISDYETEQVRLINALKYDLFRVSIGILCATIVLACLFSVLLTKKIKSILKAIKTVRGGQYDYRVKVKGRDEISELAREFNNLVARLQKTEEIRVRFVSDASHELKTPLAGIRLLSDSIVQNEDMDLETVREFVADIGVEAERLARITERMLELTRVDTASENNGVYAVDMKLVIIKALKLLSSIADERRIKLEAQLADNSIISANSDDIHQVVFNIIENAIKYNIDGGSVKVLLFQRDEEVHFIADDTGVGIPEDDMPFIFDRFYRVDKARSSEVGGSGLGLSIVREIVNKHGGSVSVSNRDHTGSRFEVIFPVNHI